LDGGESFLPNTKVSKALFSNNAPGNWIPMVKGDRLSFYLPQSMYPGAGKAGCFISSAEGHFQAIWVDSRTGVSQIWAAPIQVKAKAFPHGSEELASLEDVSSWIKLEVSETKFVPRDKLVEFDVQLHNASSNQTLVSPLKIRLLGIQSGYGTWEILKSDNKKKGVGAIWDFTEFMKNGKLKPGETTDKKHVILKLKNEIPGKYLKFRQFLDMKTKILGKKES
jgi:hypothetical protein